MKFKIIVKCEFCGCKSFRFKKIVEGKDKKEVRFNEVMNGDGDYLGWDIRTFEVSCERCNATNSEVFEIEEEGKA